MSKKQELMDQAIHLFSIKGFHQTSVQEIAQAAGISKGAFYKHYDSKESILIGILKRYHKETLQRTAEPEFSVHLNKKEIFSKKLAFEIESTLENQDFFIMVFKDMPTEDNEQLTMLMQELRNSSMELHKKNILEAFGPSVQPLLTDMASILEGTLREYLILRFLDHKQYSITKLADFITSCLEAISLRAGHLEPVLNDVNSTVFSLDGTFEAIANKIKLFSKEAPKYLAALNSLREELQKEEPRAFQIEAMLAYLKQEKQLEKEVLLLEKNI